MNIDAAVVAGMRAIALRGGHTCEILAYIAAHHRHEQVTVLLAIVYFRAAFGLTIGQAMPLGAWRGFGGSWPDEALDHDIDPLLHGAS